MPIVPETKSWTWVLEKPCPECGFDASTADAREVAEVARVVVGDEAAVPGRGHLVDARHVACRRGQGSDVLAPVVADQEAKVFFDRRQAGQLRGDEGRGDRIVLHAVGRSLDRLVDEEVLRDERDVVVSRALSAHEVAHEVGALALAVAGPGALAQGLREGDDVAHDDDSKTVGFSNREVRLPLLYRTRGLGR